MEIENLLKISLERKASDLHLVAGLAPALRIDGELVQLKTQNKITIDDAKRIIYEFMSPEQINVFEKNLSIDMALFFPSLGNFRVNVFHQLNGMGAIFRIVPEHVPTLEELEIPPVLKRTLMLSHGIVLITGATGSGKSSSMASMIDFINKTRASHIITIEDPIEYIHTSQRSNVTQLQVGRDATSFAAALRSSLRQDPDVIMLGEMRDLETIRLALTAAETGHLVLSTLHASTAPITISRIVDIFPTSERTRVRNILSETVQAIVCQALVKTIKPGRKAAYEVLLASPAIRHQISQGLNAHLESTIQTSGDLGMFSLESSLRDMMMKGLITKTTYTSALAARDSLTNTEKKKDSTIK